MVACPHDLDEMNAPAGNTVMHEAMHMAMSTESDHAQHAAHTQHPTQHPISTHDCGQCGVCHVACTPGLVSASVHLILHAAGSDSTAPSSAFRSITLPIFDPPPLLRA